MKNVRWILINMVTVTLFFVISLKYSFSQSNEESYLKSIMADPNINFFNVTQVADQFFSTHSYLITNDEEAGIYHDYTKWKSFWEDKQKTINIETLAPDLYIYNVIQDNHVVSSGKFSVVR